MTTTTDPRPLALLYVRVSTTDQVENGASLDAQAVALVESAERKGYRVELVREEGRSGKSLNGRPALVGALDRLDRGEAQALYAHRLDRLSRSVADFAHLLDRAKRKGWTVAVLDADVDTSTPGGEFLVNVLAAAAQYERRIIGARTRDGMAQRKREGVRMGRPSTLHGSVVASVMAWRLDGMTFRAIADRLNADGIRTAQGGATWYPATVRKVLQGQTAQDLRDLAATA
jgi:DNA invertase Pin-like site-specific DNA recombinase